MCILYHPGHAGHTREPDVPEYDATLAPVSTRLSGAASDAPALSPSHTHLAECVVTLKVSSNV